MTTHVTVHIHKSTDTKTKELPKLPLIKIYQLKWPRMHYTLDYKNTFNQCGMPRGSNMLQDVRSWWVNSTAGIQNKKGQKTKKKKEK